MNKNNITIAWCDNGFTDGKFTEALTFLLIEAKEKGINITNSLRVSGCQLDRQRQSLFDYWADVVKTDWILWIDSDIVVDTQAVLGLLKAADPKDRPIITGVCFISIGEEGTMTNPLPALFMQGEDGLVRHVHPIPKNALIKVDLVGMGFVLMHKSIVPKLREKFPNKFLFEQERKLGDEYVGEDIAFFKKVKQAGIPVYAWTGSLTKHMKRFSLDINHYSLYWNVVNNLK